jgi:hypothetical protein
MAEIIDRYATDIYADISLPQKDKIFFLAGGGVV